MPPIDPFAARMLAQIALIERYRVDVLRHEGRRLDADGAAIEWICRYAEHFPPPEQFDCESPSATAQGGPRPARARLQPRPRPLSPSAG